MDFEPTPEKLYVCEIDPTYVDVPFRAYRFFDEPNDPGLADLRQPAVGREAGSFRHALTFVD
ncbi:MAG: hypothetical protein ABSC25_10960 [Roseiarcus sp.]|jgi:hypothetical protein